MDHGHHVTRGGDQSEIGDGNVNETNLAPTLWNIANASSVDISAQSVELVMDGEEDHDEELYATEQLQVGHTTTGYHVHQDTPGALPASFKNDNDLGAALPASFRNDEDLSAALPNSIPPKSPKMRVTPQGSAEPLMPHKVCTQCEQQMDEDNGRMDENDGDWYCDECWNTFYE